MPAAMERLSHELALQRDRQVRLQSVQTDLQLDLPPRLPLPDGEEVPYGSATKMQIRDSDQQSEIYRECVRAPPNRTVFDGEPPPPYWSCGGDSTAVVRCHNLGRLSPRSQQSSRSSRNLPCLSGAVGSKQTKTSGGIVSISSNNHNNNNSSSGGNNNSVPNLAAAHDQQEAGVFVSVASSLSPFPSPPSPPSPSSATSISSRPSQLSAFCASDSSSTSSGCLASLTLVPCMDSSSSSSSSSPSSSTAHFPQYQNSHRHHRHNYNQQQQAQDNNAGGISTRGGTSSSSPRSSLPLAANPSV